MHNSTLYRDARTARASSASDTHTRSWKKKRKSDQKELLLNIFRFVVVVIRLYISEFFISVVVAQHLLIFCAIVEKKAAKNQSLSNFMQPFLSLLPVFFSSLFFLQHIFHHTAYVSSFECE